LQRTYFVYILASRSRTLYTGVTNNLFRRVLQHRSGVNDAFTEKYKVFRLVYFETFHDVRNAIAREKEIKGWDRRDRVGLIQSRNPTWEDMAADWGTEVSSLLKPESRSLTAEAVRDDN